MYREEVIIFRIFCGVAGRYCRAALHQGGMEVNRKKIAEDFISPRTDIVFKELMRDDTVRRHFLSDVLDIPLDQIKSVRLENTFLSRRSRQEKQGILDVRMQLNGESRINVELQIRRLVCWDKRSLYYLAKMYTEGLGNGQHYDNLKKCIVIDVLDFPGDENPGYHKVYHLRDAEGRLYSKEFEVHIIELGKALTGDKVDDWIRLLRVESREELEHMHSRNAGVVRAIDEVRTMNLGRRLRMWHEMRLKEQRDRWAIEEALKEDAYAEGHTKGCEAGRAEGLAKGLAEGRAEGYKAGCRQGILELLEEYGDIPDDIRARISAETDLEVLRKWHKAAARAESASEFREQMQRQLT